MQPLTLNSNAALSFPKRCIALKRYAKGCEREAQADQARDLEQERQVYERMLERQSEASRQYSVGKFKSA
ncbi:hypothetical protein B30_20568 [Celeribacter baekdonensis B30]|jgi:hypothetical protein|uniref:Uncharacterized protein n=3 Tax=Roseobacteraceae TaxID=2854170 RepID=K2IXZ5_9RHOB|nr:hypothetical protein DA792_02630 [Celeribacter baekdonensis]EKE67502.1 hypothetical protein B30_20568 [Celeribacter baekdonensis B30]